MDTTGSIFMPPGGSTIAGDVDALFHFILYVGIILFLIVTIASAFFVVKYRRRGKVSRTYGKAYNLPLEIAWTAIPTVLILIVFVWGFRTYMKMSIVPADALEVKVTGQKWFWTFDYAEGASSTNELVVPVATPVKLLMSSQDVIHSFFVPNFRIKMDVLPNRYSVTWFEATREGEYDLFCTEFCGKGHSEMIGKVRVVSDSAFNAWIEAGATLGEGMTLEEFGSELYVKRACNTCHSLDGTRNVGPTFQGIWGRQEVMKDGTQITVDENYVRESILNPQAKIVTGYEPVMPTYQGLLKPREVDALIAFLKGLESQ